MTPAEWRIDGSLISVGWKLDLFLPPGQPASAVSLKLGNPANGRPQFQGTLGLGRARRRLTLGIVWGECGETPSSSSMTPASARSPWPWPWPWPSWWGWAGYLASWCSCRSARCKVSAATRPSSSPGAADLPEEGLSAGEGQDVEPVEDALGNVDVEVDADRDAAAGDGCARMAAVLDVPATWPSPAVSSRSRRMHTCDSGPVGWPRAGRGPAAGRGTSRASRQRRSPGRRR